MCWELMKCDGDSIPRCLFLSLYSPHLHMAIAMVHVQCPTLSDDGCKVIELIIAQSQTSVSSSGAKLSIGSSHHNSWDSNPPLWLVNTWTFWTRLGFPVCVHKSVTLSGAPCPDPVTTFLWARITRWTTQASLGRKIVLKRPGSVNKIAVIEMKLVRKRMKALICG